MPNDFSQKTVFGIKIGDFTGIYRAIADKANVNGGNTLVGKEINLFYEAKNTIDKSKSIFQFDGKTYDSEGKLYTGKAPLIAEPDATMVKFSWHPKPDDFFKAEEARSKNEAALQKVDEYIAVEKAEAEKAKQQQRISVEKIANSWEKTFKVDNHDGSFTKFVERLYEAAKELDITKTNDGKTKETFVPSEKYATIEDQIVDEMCAAFANESQFSTKAVSGSKLYYGIFQFSQVGIDDLKQHKYIPSKKLAPIEGNRIQNFTKLTRLQQLDYMVAYVSDCKKYYSQVEGQPISPKQMYALWVDPWVAKTNPNQKQKQLIQKQEGVIKAKQAERDKNAKL